MIFIIKEKVYYKTIEESNIRIYESGKFEGLDASCHYIFVMKKYSNMRDVKILAEIKRRLKQHNREFKEISVKNFQIDLFGNLFIIESALKTYLGH
ncbi:hypothetical protein A5880_001736 [Enterococcus sp. 4G2_DIV0659]|uniref:Uncharacterized protein n=1 Tax=Candidatus Enterococcus mansonii TaxID=1834181 RepID=A0ABU8IFM7_9ENTE